MDKDKPIPLLSNKFRDEMLKKGDGRYLGKKTDYPNLPQVGWIINDNRGNKYIITNELSRQRWIIRLKKKEETSEDVYPKNGNHHRRGIPFPGKEIRDFQTKTGN